MFKQVIYIPMRLPNQVLFKSNCILFNCVDQFASVLHQVGVWCCLKTTLRHPLRMVERKLLGPNPQTQWDCFEEGELAIYSWKKHDALRKVNRKQINHYIHVLKTGPLSELILEVEFVPGAVMKSQHANALGESAQNDFQQISNNILRAFVTMSINILLSVFRVPSIKCWTMKHVELWTDGNLGKARPAWPRPHQWPIQ